jgi:hypothetical protein
MLELDRVVKGPDSEAAIYVFTDTEKGHTVYMSHTGVMTVIEKEGSGKVRAAGFMLGSDECSSCSGC